MTNGLKRHVGTKLGLRMKLVSFEKLWTWLVLAQTSGPIFQNSSTFKFSYLLIMLLHIIGM